jgi:hypothetical protein
MHSEYIEIGRRPWKYRPGGSAIVPPLSEAPAERSSFHSNDLGELGAAVANGVQEISFDLDSSEDWENTVCRILRKLSCHAIMNIRLNGAWSDADKARLKDVVFAYDAQDHVYYTQDGE